jgi:CheY-like chemotaxis protein
VRQILSLAHGLEGGGNDIGPKHLLKDLEKIIKETFPGEARLNFSLPSDTWTIAGDASQVHQILLNICVNAEDSLPHQGELTISVENCELNEQYATMHIRAKVGRYVSINVTHSEPSLPQGILDNIFEPFFAAPEASDSALDSSHLPRGNGETILVVDDEASILTITSQTLEAFGYRTLTAKDGADAIAIYAQHRNEIAVVLTDMMMPVMDGPATIKVLRRINPAVRIVASSGLHMNSSMAKGGDVKYFLPKPYSPEILLKTVRAVLDEA